MDTPRREKRRNNRKADSASRIARIGLKDGLGHTRWLTADVLDQSPSGAGLSLARPVEVGKTIEFRANGAQSALCARIVWCREQGDGTYMAGVDFVDAGGSEENGSGAGISDQEIDCYEVMQLSPNADMETIHRVYRILAQRYHPDNKTSGSNGLFLRLCEAYAILSDPALRASYDARHREVRQVRRKIISEMETAAGRTSEKQKRQGILELLYAKLLHDFEHPTLTIHEMEDLLGCPREHLQAALWYLKGKGHIQRSDNGRYAITVDGFEHAESQASPPTEAALRGHLLSEARDRAVG